MSLHPFPAKQEAEPVEGEAPTPLARYQAAKARPRLAWQEAEASFSLTRKGPGDLIEPSKEIAAEGYAAFGSGDPDFVAGLLRTCLYSTTGNADDVKRTEKDANFLLSVVKEIEPSDPVEAMLAAQMAVTHRATMTFAKRMEQGATYLETEMAEKAFTKLARTYAAQVEALKRYRSDGGQQVIVKHVHVHEGGQAIVGNVDTGGRGRRKKGAATT